MVRSESVAYLPRPDGAQLWASSTISRSNLRGYVGSFGPGRISRNSRSGRSRLRKSMEVIRRGKWFHGLTWMPRSRRSSLMSSLSTMRKSSPNLSRICSCHWTWSDDGQTIRIFLARWRMISSRATIPASMVLPRPTSSATRRLTRGIWMARTTGSSW